MDLDWAGGKAFISALAGMGIVTLVGEIDVASF